MGLNFNQAWLESVARFRSETATELFQAITFMGGVEGYLIIIALIYGFFGKRLAVSASIVVLLSMIANHLLKTLIQNPRPFVEDGTYQDAWAVSAARASELVAEYSTPSGHAMAAAAFYGFLVLRATDWRGRFGLILVPILIGISRPVLGVHYFEDIALGWLLGGGIAAFAAYRIDAFWARWCNLDIGMRTLFALLLSRAVWGATLALTGRSVSELPTEFVSVLGFLSGVLMAAPLEAKNIKYEVLERSLITRGVRFILMLSILVATLIILEIPTLLISEPVGLVETVWRYVRYAIVGAIGVLFVPWLFIRMKLAASEQNPGEIDRAA